ncbi:NAD(P)-binding protein [Aspergillus stella-maris]|uniref:NAD(P)-binding protein n=1 Tax=Aspergillus stella-maris TaxID=1810926 RepID=UPI003CCDF3DD
MTLDIPKEKILITGVTGYIGFKTLLIALERGYPIRALIRKQAHIAGLTNKSSAIAEATKTGKLEFTIVPDFLDQNAVFTALQGITGIIHLASPLAVQTENYKKDIIRPAVSMVTTFLEAARRVESVKRVVITSSCVTLIPFQWNMDLDSERFYNSASDINPTLNSTPTNPMEAYWLSKALARRAVCEFTSTPDQYPKPIFDTVQLLPGVVIGPDDRLDPSKSNKNPASAVLSGTRAAVLAPALTADLNSAFPYVTVPVHVSDVARAHVDALDTEKVRGGSEFILAADTDNLGEGVNWDRDVRDVARKYFSDEVESGVLPCQGSLGSIRWKLDTRDTERVFGWKMSGFEETARSLLRQYLELKALEAKD